MKSDPILDGTESMKFPRGREETAEVEGVDPVFWQERVGAGTEQGQFVGSLVVS